MGSCKNYPARRIIGCINRCVFDLILGNLYFCRLWVSMTSFGGTTVIHVDSSHGPCQHLKPRASVVAAFIVWMTCVLANFFLLRPSTFDWILGGLWVWFRLVVVAVGCRRFGELGKQRKERRIMVTFSPLTRATKVHVTHLLKALSCKECFLILGSEFDGQILNGLLKLSYNFGGKSE